MRVYRMYVPLLAGLLSIACCAIAPLSAARPFARTPVGARMSMLPVRLTGGGADGSVASPATTVVTATDTGPTRPISLRIGMTLRVLLHESYSVPGAGSTWDTPHSSDPRVLAPVSATRRPPLPRNALPHGDYTLIADFRAKAPGRDSVSATRTDRCEACARQSAPHHFTLAVTVGR